MKEEFLSEERLAELAELAEEADAWEDWPARQAEEQEDFPALELALPLANEEVASPALVQLPEIKLPSHGPEPLPERLGANIVLPETGLAVTYPAHTEDPMALSPEQATELFLAEWPHYRRMVFFFAQVAGLPVEEHAASPEPVTLAAPAPKPKATAARTARIVPSTEDPVVEKIKGLVCREWKLPLERFWDQNHPTAPIARGVAYYLTQEFLGISQGHVAQRWGRAQSVVCAGLRRFRVQIANNKELAGRVERLLAELRDEDK